MKIDKKNIAVLVFLLALGIMFILIIYAANSDKSKKPKEEKKEETKNGDSKQALIDDADVDTLFDIFSKLDTDSDSLRLVIDVTPSEERNERDLTNEEKLFVVFSTIPYREHGDVDCANLSDSFRIPDNLSCTKRSYSIHRGIVLSRYDELFGYDKELELNDFLTYVYDEESYKYIYLESNLEEIEYDMPRARLREAYMEDNKLIIKYDLDYSTGDYGYYKEEVVLKFKKINDNYIFESKKTNIYN